MLRTSVAQAVVAASMLAWPVAANAQNQVTDQANAVAEQAKELQEEANQLTNVVAEERQDNATTTAAGDDRERDDREDRDDDDGFDWGLLGLLGLAGLLGLKRRDDHRHVHADRDVHVDGRRDTDRTARL